MTGFLPLPCSVAVRITISTTFLDTDIEFFGAFNASSIHSFARRPDNSLKTKWSPVQNAKKKGAAAQITQC